MKKRCRYCNKDNGKINKQGYHKSCYEKYKDKGNRKSQDMANRLMRASQGDALNSGLPGGYDLNYITPW